MALPTLKITLPKLKKAGGVTSTPTFKDSGVGRAITPLITNTHLRDLYTDRAAKSDVELIQELMQVDPDVSAAVNAYLTVANTEMTYIVTDLNGKIDRPAMVQLNTILEGLTETTDYSIGFTPNKSLKATNAALRFMLLLRGSIGLELVTDVKNVNFLSSVRIVDTNSLEWYEDKPGQLKPKQKQDGGKLIDLNIPTFFYSSFRQDPTQAYSKSPFISVINTVFARQQIINDLYRLMQITGYPRMVATVLEDTIRNTLPVNYRSDPEKSQAYVNNVISDIDRKLQTLRPDQPFVKTDSIQMDMLNEGNATMGLDIQPIINVLNAQNQAALKSMATILGRGQAGVNTASVEARIFSLVAQELNEPIDLIWGQLLTLALRLQGSQSTVTVKHKGVELRPANELEPANIQKQARLLNDLSYGIIDDDTYHLEMYGRIRPDYAPILSGTGFRSPEAPEIAQGAGNPNSSAQNQSKKASDKGANSNAVRGG